MIIELLKNLQDNFNDLENIPLSQWDGQSFDSTKKLISQMYEFVEIQERKQRETYRMKNPMNVQLGLEELLKLDDWSVVQKDFLRCIKN